MLVDRTHSNRTLEANQSVEPAVFDFTRFVTALGIILPGMVARRKRVLYR